jgi:hypothetical protein
MESGQSALIFAVVREGSIDRGRYLLLEYVNSQIQLSDSIRTLSLHVAEVLHKHGEDIEDVGVGASWGDVTDGYSVYIAHDDYIPDDIWDETDGGSGMQIASVPDDGDGDSTSPIFDISDFVDSQISTTSSGGSSSKDMDFGTLGIRVGDRLTVTYIPADEDGDADVANPITKVTWVSEVGSKDGKGKITRLTVDPELPLSASTPLGSDYEDWDGVVPLLRAWKFERSSISYAIYEADYLRRQVLSLKDMASKYTVGTSDKVDAIFTSLLENGLDRAKDLLTTGKVEEFFGLDSDTSTYSGRAKAAINEFAKKLI